MPFLDAKALETDPDGMAFLRSVIRPNFKQDEAVAPPVARADPRRAFQVPPRPEGNIALGATASEAVALPAA